MHELSIATSILKTAEEEVNKVDGESVSNIYLEIGKLAGVEIESLNFVWEQCMKNTVLEQANLFINEPNGKAKCIECETVFKLVHIFDFCPKCKSPFKEVLEGKELKIKKLIIV